MTRSERRAVRRAVLEIAGRHLANPTDVLAVTAIDVDDYELNHHGRLPPTARREISAAVRAAIATDPTLAKQTDPPDPAGSVAAGVTAFANRRSTSSGRPRSQVLANGRRAFEARHPSRYPAGDDAA